MAFHNQVISIRMMLLLIMGHGPAGLLSERPRFSSSHLYGADAKFEHEGDRYALHATFHTDLHVDNFEHSASTYTLCTSRCNPVHERGARSFNGVFYCPRGSTSPVTFCSLHLTTYLKDASYVETSEPRKWHIDFSYDRRVLHMTIYSDKKHCQLAIEMPFSTFHISFAKMIGLQESRYYEITCSYPFDELTPGELAERNAFHRDILGPAHDVLSTFLDQIIDDNPFARVTLRQVVPDGTEILEGGCEIV